MLDEAVVVAVVVHAVLEAGRARSLNRDLAFRDLQGALGLSVGHAKQVIGRLLELRLVVGRSNPLDRRSTLYRVVPLPLWSRYRDMRDGLPEPLRDVLPLLFSIKGVHAVLLLGSHAREDFDGRSDIDVLVVGDDPERVLDLTYQACLSSPIDLHTCTPDEFRNSLYPLIPHVVLYDDGTCEGATPRRSTSQGSCARPSRARERSCACTGTGWFSSIESFRPFTSWSSSTPCSTAQPSSVKRTS